MCWWLLDPYHVTFQILVYAYFGIYKLFMRCSVVLKYDCIYPIAKDMDFASFVYDAVRTVAAETNPRIIDRNYCSNLQSFYRLLPSTMYYINA